VRGKAADLIAMNEPEALRAKAEAVLGGGEPVLAAGIFGLRGGGVALTAGGVAGSVVGSAVLGSVGGAVGNIAGMHAGRDRYAAKQGLAAVLLVAVTPSHIHILDWANGTGASELLRSYERASTRVEIKKWGLSRRVSLHGASDGSELALTGTAASSKAVLAALG
jgi:hypothetical protein